VFLHGLIGLNVVILVEMMQPEKKTATVKTPATPKGTECGEKTKSEICDDLPACPVDCVGEWEENW
jgi:hypothetical protein